jgi:hypothetical protein
MSYETRAGFRFVQPKNSWDEPKIYCFFGVDQSIHFDQIKMLGEQLNQDNDRLIANRRKKAYKAAYKTRALWWNHFYKMDDDGYGSFRLWFDLEIWELDDEELEACYQDIHDSILSTEFMADFMAWYDIEQSLEDWVEDDDAESVMTRYLDLVLKTGYCAYQRDVMDLFQEYLDPKVVGQHFLMRLLRGENVKCVDVSEPDPDNTWDCFDTEQTVA